MPTTWCSASRPTTTPEPTSTNWPKVSKRPSRVWKCSAKTRSCCSPTNRSDRERSAQRPSRPHREFAHLQHRVFVSVRTLTSDADPDGLVDQHGPSDVVARPDLPVAHHRAAGNTARRIEVDEYAGRLGVDRLSQRLGGGTQRFEGNSRLRHVQ